MSSSILPTISPDTIQVIVPRRYWKFALYLLCVFGALATLSLFHGARWDHLQLTRDWSPFAQSPQPYNTSSPVVDLTGSPDYPPDYAEWHKIEEALPQHNQNLSFPEGKEGRYVYFSEHVKSTSILILTSHYLRECLAADVSVPQQRRDGGTYSRSTFSTVCWHTSDGDRA